MTKEALTLALEALKSSNKLINGTGTKFGLAGAMDGYYSGCFDVEGNNKLLTDAIAAIKEALAQPEQEKERCVGCEACIDTACGRDECPNGWPKAAQPEKDIPKIGCVNHDCDKCKAQPEQEPVAMKFKIYKPTVPDPTRQDINNALLPWVYDQDRSSGFDASMWVTPVSTLPPQRTWVGLTDGEWMNIVNKDHAWYGQRPDEVAHEVAKLVEAKLRTKNG